MRHEHGKCFLKPPDVCVCVAKNNESLCFTIILLPFNGPDIFVSHMGRLFCVYSTRFRLQFRTTRAWNGFIVRQCIDAGTMLQCRER
jgi:hypothetical protein